MQVYLRDSRGEDDSRLKLKPGQKGTKKLVDIYGDDLVCVRYRYDEAAGLRIKTAEIVVERKRWSPPAPKIVPDEIVQVQIVISETKYREMAKAAGGHWDRDAKLWRVPFGNIKGTELEKHIILDAHPTNGNKKSI